MKSMEAIIQLSQLTEKHGLEYSVTKRNQNTGQFADYIIELPNNLMLGLVLNVIGSQKPLSLFPQMIGITFEELDQLLSEITEEAKV